MKTIVIRALLATLLGIALVESAFAQGTVTYLSNLGQTPDGNNPVGSDSWLAASFFTGANAAGYTLNSVQLGLANGTGGPNGFSVMVYTATDIAGAVRPTSSLGTLSGPTDPATGGTFAYTTASSLTLSPDSEYFIVLTAGSTVANGAYVWSFVNTSSYQPLDGWIAAVTLTSSNGSPPSWARLGSSPNYDYSLFAINATPAPEPGVICLFALGGLLVAFQRRKARSV